MAASAWRVYNEAKKFLLNGTIDLDTSAMRIKLCLGTKAASVSNYTRSTFASLTHQTANITTPTRTLTNVAVTALNGSATIKFDFDDEVWTASGGNITSVQYAVIGVSNGACLAWCKLSTASIDITSGNTLTIQINTNGAFTLSGDGDGKTDIAVYRHGSWFIILSSAEKHYGIGWGGDPSDVPLNPTSIRYRYY